jgi:hypothetical protein
VGIAKELNPGDETQAARHIAYRVEVALSNPPGSRSEKEDFAPPPRPASESQCFSYFLEVEQS